MTRYIKTQFYKIIRKAIFKSLSEKYAGNDSWQLREIMFRAFKDRDPILESMLKKYVLEAFPDSVQLREILLKAFKDREPILESMLKKYILEAVPEIQDLKCSGRHIMVDSFGKTTIGKDVKLYSPYHIYECFIGDYTYIAQNSYMSYATVGRFCSIGPNLICGWGIHPLEGISTHPMFFSTLKQNGMTLSSEDKVEERKHITIGNDVFIGANVIILDGITIGDGAVIGAGAVVSKDIPPYAIAVGCPIKVKKYRFPVELCKRLRNIKWWDFDLEQLKDVEANLFNVKKFVEQYESQRES